MLTLSLPHLTLTLIHSDTLTLTLSTLTHSRRGRPILDRLSPGLSAATGTISADAATARGEGVGPSNLHYQ